MGPVAIATFATIVNAALLMRQNTCRGYFAFNRTQMVEMVT